MFEIEPALTGAEYFPIASHAVNVTEYVPPGYHLGITWYEPQTVLGFEVVERMVHVPAPGGGLPALIWDATARIGRSA